MKRLFALVLVLIMCLSLFACGKKDEEGNSAEDVAKKFAKAFSDGDIKSMLKMIPDELHESMFDGMDREEFIAQYEEYWEIAQDYGMEISCKFIEIEEMDDDEKEELKEELEEEYGLKITDACYAVLKMDMAGETEQDDAAMVKIDGEWYFCGTP